MDVLPEGKTSYKGRPKWRPRHPWESEGRKVLIEGRDNTTLPEGSLPALVMVFKARKDLMSPKGKP